MDQKLWKSIHAVTQAACCSLFRVLWPDSLLGRLLEPQVSDEKLRTTAESEELRANQPLQRQLLVFADLARRSQCQIVCFGSACLFRELSGCVNVPSLRALSYVFERTVVWFDRRRSVDVPEKHI